jgi:hypothetical protein
MFTSERGQTHGDLFLDLVVAMLAVNRWSLERAHALSANLAATGFGDQVMISHIDVPAIARLLDVAGYSRGEYMRTLLARRIKDAAMRFAKLDPSALTEMEGARDVSGLRDVLMQIEGVGPQVFDNFRILRSL